MQTPSLVKKIVSYFSLFGSLTTLFCCALPVLLVSLGMGAVFASVTSAIPQINLFVEHKNILFVITGILLSLSYVWMARALPQECPIDQKEACQASKPWTRRIFWFSVVIYAIGFLFSYILPFIFYG